MAGSSLDELARDLLRIARSEHPRKVKQMLKRSANKLKKKVVAKAKAETKKKTGTYIKGFKAGKPYVYEGDTDAVRVYNGSPHAHLIEQGHRNVDKTGREHGYTAGKRILEKSGDEYGEEFEKDIEVLVDELLDSGDLR
jgi:hypothetical protein